MKKIIIIMCGILLVGTTGCGSSSKEELKCTLTEDNATETVILTFEKDTLKKMTYESKETYDTEEDLDDDYGFAQFTVGLSNAMDGVEAKIDKKDLTLSTTITYDFNKMSEDIKKDMLEEMPETKEGIISSFEDDGYTCK